MSITVSAGLAFAAAHRNGVLVTARANGRPQLSNIIYAVRGDEVLISVTSGRAKYHNLLRNPAASLYVTQEDFWAYVVLDGEAVVSPPAADPHDATAEELIALYRDLAGEHPDWDDYRRAMVAEGRAVVHLTVASAYGMLPA